jgi:Tfp pilus assembly protein PilN
MLRTNLSTRPFYNERAVHALLTIAGLVVLVLTIFNLYEIVVLSREQSELGSRASVSETRARELRAHAAQIRQGLDPKQLDAIFGEAREANAIIGQRLFSWTELLNRLETTLPEEVRITAMRPRVENDGSITIQMNITGRRFEDINRFLENLEGTGAFTDMLPRDEITTEDGLHQATIEGHYLPSAGPAPAKGAR